MNVTIELNKLPDAQAVALPQAELFKGANGYVLVVQLKEKSYSLLIPALINQIAAEEYAAAQNVPTPVDASLAEAMLGNIASGQ